MATNNTDDSAQEAILAALQQMAKAIKGGTDAQKDGNKISKKALLQSEGIIKAMSIGKNVLTKILSVQGDTNRAFLGFGRDVEKGISDWQKTMKDSTTSMAEDMKAFGGVFSVGIKQNVAHTVKLNHSLLVLGKDTSKWNKTIAVQNQVYRQNAKHTGSLVEAMIDNTLGAKLDTDKLATAITGLSTTMDHLAVTMGAGVPMMAVEAIANMQNELGNQSFTDMATKVLSFYLSSANSDKLLKLTGGKMNLTSVGGFEDLIRVLGRESLRAFNAGQNLGGGFLQHYAGPKFAGAMGATSDAANMGRMISNPIPGDHTTGKGLHELARQASQNDIMRTFAVLMKNLSISLTPLVISLSQMVNASIVPQLHNAMGRLAVKVADMAAWMRQYVPDRKDLGGTTNPDGTETYGPPYLAGIGRGGGELAPWLSAANAADGSTFANMGLQSLRGATGGLGGMARGATGAPAVNRLGSAAFQKLKGSMVNRFNVGKMFSNKGLTGGAVRITSSRFAKVLGEGIEKGAVLSMEAFTAALNKSGVGKIITAKILEQAGFSNLPKSRLLPKLLGQLTSRMPMASVAKAALTKAGGKIIASKALGTAGALLDIWTLAELSYMGYKYFNPDTMFEIDQSNMLLGNTAGGGAFLDGKTESDVMSFAKEISDWTGDPLEDVRELLLMQYNWQKEVSNRRVQTPAEIQFNAELQSEYSSSRNYRG